jgi:OOP family OmpA-OmpF porin
MSLRIVLLSLGLVLAGCSNKNDAAEQRAAEAEVAAQMPSGPESLPMQEGSSPAAMPTTEGSGDMSAAGATMTTVTPDFDPASVQTTSASLPPFPFFKDPEGLVNDLQGADQVVAFDRHYFIAGNKLVAQEGKMGLFQYNLENPPSGRKWTQVEFMRNYDNAITALGGVKISTAQYSPELLATLPGGRDEVEKFRHATSPADRRAEHAAYLIRTADKEYWIHVSAGDTIPLMGFVTALEKQGMKSSIGFLDAAAMKKELEATGKVTLYINFDTDKATLRPDAQPIMDEIHKLLVADAALKLSIEGHTDGTGGADHNRQLSTARARAVFGALVGLGVDPSRLASKGFGPDKPIADNGTEEGRAKNRRVELVKTN